MKIDSFQSLLLDQLRELHSAEIQLSKALPALITGAYASELKDALAEHLEQTHLHVELRHELPELSDNASVHRSRFFFIADPHQRRELGMKADAIFDRTESADVSRRFGQEFNSLFL